MANADKIKQFIRNRGSIKQKLTMLEKFINTIKVSEPDKRPSMSEVEIKYNNFEPILQEFEEVQLNIEINCEEENLAEHYIEREKFEARYSSSLAFLKEYLKNNSEPINFPSVRNSSNLPQANDSLQGIILPKIKLPVFKGDYENWLEFKTTFMSLIHTNIALNNTQKYQFLRAALEGYAKRIIDNIEFTENHYESAWNILCRRFDNKRVLINNHIKSIFNLESMPKESSVQFRQLLDNISKHISALDGLNLSKEILFDTLVIFIISNKLDKVTYRDWKEYNCKEELPTLDEFLEFLKNKADLLEVLHDTKPQVQNTKYSSGKNYSHSHLALNNLKCNFCKGQHLIYNCSEFLKLDVTSRIDKVNKLKLCNNCLRTGHVKENCKLGPCRKCKSQHNTLLHVEKNIKNNSESTAFNDTNGSTTTNTSTNLLVRPNTSNTQVLLSTVVFDVKDDHGNLHPCRALLDSGAQSNLITENFCKKLNLPLISTKLSIIGINQAVSNLTKKCNLSIFSHFNTFKASITCYVTPSISGEIPTEKIITFNWNIPENIQLSDSQFYEPKEIDVLIGANLFWDLLLDGKITLGKGLPILQNTKLGWIVSGNAPVYSSKSICNFSKTIFPEDEQLKRFWEIEEVISNSSMLADEIECEQLFEKTTYRDDNGRFVVQFPFKHPLDLLGDSQDTAIRRFFSLEKKFASNPKLKTQYKNFIDEYIALGHMSKLEHFQGNSNTINYFLPHHGILKETSLTTKLRVVFDGSCPSDTGWSLNDLQFIGPKVQNDIFSILLRFRIYAFVVSADIMKMYRQIIMHPDHRPLQRIIWRDDPTKEFSIYQLNTITYGTSSAPYLAIKCLKTLAIKNQTQFPQASAIILNDFYVDDLLTGSNDIQELSIICKQVSSILETGGFVLRKWISNNKEVLADIDVHNDSLGILPLGDNESSKTLGVQWVSQSDILTYNISQSILPEHISKRQVLSDISQIYDPLGLVSPCILIAKLIIQKLWSLKLSWDEPIPSDLYSKWCLFRDQLSQLSLLEIPRNAIGQGFQLLDIHCFCDASQEAYTACVYLRSQDFIGTVQTKLFCSKTKIAPLKSVSIPRLELCAALLGAQLCNQVKQSLCVDVPYHFWSDSQVVLHWLNTEPNLLEVFVANRVSKIQGLTNPDNWHYVNTKQNPADIASRGIFPIKLLECSIWWNGPEFLCNSKIEWPSFSFNLNKDIPEMRKRKTEVFSVIVKDTWDIFSKYSNLHKLKRVVTYCLRFIHNLKSKPNDRNIDSLTLAEIDVAYTKLIKLAQSESFKEEISILSKDKFLDSKHKLSSLSPFLDNNGILRVGGRLKFSSLDNNVKHPILLSANHNLTKLIFNHKHTYLLHPGPQLLLASVRQQYWPIGGKILAKKVVRNCITCFKFSPVPCSAPMGPIPNHRLSPALPFQIIGIDYAGPLLMKSKKGRGSTTSKCYICIFVCFISKAIHLELITDMTTESFLACLKRFTSRRGFPTHIYSDNGSTFQGAHNELQSLGQFLYKSQSQINDHATKFNITWHFTPPYSPNFGGLWEAAVKSTKHHLKRVVNDTALTYEELSTLLCQIEGILNSRPLFAMSDNPNDLEPLTPSHFLIGRPITSLPTPDLQNIAQNRLSRLQYVQKLQQQFWTRFSKEYISQLHQSYKWKAGSPPVLKIGMLVLIKLNNQPPNKWPLGRIQQLFPGNDGISRVASIVTTRGIIKRSTRNLCPLPMEDDVTVK